ncbi:UPF0104 family protein [Enterovirga sp. DB1703]|uniref:UPF0104 family protein n=1 Tax=Enterovirga aerilata TaxID=2730920 RepID=A0A849I7P7_9HYPH|nr:UPF0104 family protein [Enterovirga sp. DB1703]
MLSYVLALAGLALAGYLIHRGLSRYTVEDITASLRAIPVSNLALAALFAAASYLCLTGFDWLALRYVGKPLPYPRAALASFVSLSLGHSIGFAGLSSGAFRYRYYSRWGLSAGDVAKVVIFCGATVGTGLLVLGAAALLLKPDIPASFTGLAHGTVRLVGAGCLALACLYLLLAAKFRRGIVIRGWRVEMPPLRLALAQTALGTVNFALVAACLGAAVSAASEARYLDVATAYVTGNVMTLLTHVPGGLGVIETAVMYLLPGTSLIGPLIAFRVIYFLVPLAIGSLVFVIAEVAFRRSGAASDRRRPERREKPDHRLQQAEGALRVE